MIKSKKYVFLLVTAKNNPPCEWYQTNLDGWPALKSHLDSDPRIEIVELSSESLHPFKLNGTNNERINGLVKYVPAFILVSYDDFHNGNIINLPAQIYGCYGGRHVCDPGLSSQAIMDWVRTKLTEVPLSLIPLAKTQRSKVLKLLCLTHMPSSKLNGKTIKQYIPRLLFLSRIVVSIYDDLIWSS